MVHMNKQVLNYDQEQLLPFIKSFSSSYYLVGGTAIALHLGHQRSIDFDLLTDIAFDPMVIRNSIMKSNTTLKKLNIWMVLIKKMMR